MASSSAMRSVAFVSLDWPQCGDITTFCSSWNGNADGPAEQIGEFDSPGKHVSIADGSTKQVGTKT